MKLSTRGAAFIGRYEGLRLYPYNDAAGYATIGYGHLLHYSNVTGGDRAKYAGFTQADALALLKQDATKAEFAVAHYIHVLLTQPQFDALVSFVFNCGAGALAGSVGRAINAGQDPTAALMQWDHAGGRELPGLASRRKAEAHLFNTGDYGDGQKPWTPGPAPKPVVTVPKVKPAWYWIALKQFLAARKKKG